MDSLNNALYSASHAIWGETHPEHIKQQQQEQHGDEPLSGVQGKGVADDPYDGGNRDIQPGIPAEPEVFTTPIGHDAPGLSSAVVNSENYESQLGGEETAATGATAGPTGWDATHIPMNPEDPPYGTDPVSTDATALSSTLNQSAAGGGGGGVMGVPSVSRQPMGSTGLNRDVGPSIGAVNQTSVNPASIGAGTAELDEYGDFDNAASDKCVRGLDLAGGSNGETSDRVEGNTVEDDDPIEEPTAGGVDGVGGEGEGDGGDDEVYAQVPSVPGHGPSKEALRGPSAPPAREEYEFERNLSQIKPAHTKPKAHKAAKSAAEDHPQKANVMSKMKERFGRAGNHFHHTNKT